MKLDMAEQPVLIQVAAWSCTVVFLVSFIAFMSGIALTLIKTRAMVTEPEEWKLPYWHRAAIKNRRASSFMLLDEFRPLRRLMFASMVGSFGSFGCLFLIIVMFGERT